MVIKILKLKGYNYSKAISKQKIKNPNIGAIYFYKLKNKTKNVQLYGYILC